MSLIKKILQITNIKVSEILEKNNNKSHTTPLIKDNDIMCMYNNSNKQIEKLRHSIQKTKQ